MWHAIHDNQWDYNEIYDRMYRVGRPTHNMRVSYLGHSWNPLDILQMAELEPETWEDVMMRLRGVQAARHLRITTMTPKELPEAFDTWLEYREYLMGITCQTNMICT